MDDEFSVIILCAMALFVVFGYLKNTRRGMMLCGYVHITWRRLRRGCVSSKSRVRFASVKDDHDAPSPDDEEERGSDCDDDEEELLPPEIIVTHMKSHKD